MRRLRATLSLAIALFAGLLVLALLIWQLAELLSWSG
jgi:hypothetical protein